MLALTTALATYFMNDSILAGDYFFAGIFGLIVLRNLHFSYQITKVIRFFNKPTKK